MGATLTNNLLETVFTLVGISGEKIAADMELAQFLVDNNALDTCRLRGRPLAALIADGGELAQLYFKTVGEKSGWGRVVVVVVFMLSMY